MDMKENQAFAINENLSSFKKLGPSMQDYNFHLFTSTFFVVPIFAPLSDP